MAQNTSEGTVLIGGVPYRSLRKDYKELKKIIDKSGLLSHQPGYYALQMLEVVVLYAISITILIVVDNVWVQMANAVLLGLASTRGAFLVHDAGHRSIFRNPKYDNPVGWFFANFLLGTSSGWWIDYHNEHHAAPNELHTDPAIDLPFWAFDNESALEKSGFWRFMVRWQAYLYIPLMTLQAFFLRIGTFEHLVLNKKTKHRAVEIVLVVINLSIYIWLIFSNLPVGAAIAFVVIHHVYVGVHLGMVFAPNHKGMPTIEEGAKIDFMLQQTITTRNVRPSILVDYLYGGLNYQIEHHLFPGTPRNKLGGVREITKEFCEARDIPYYETGAIESYIEMFHYMNDVAKQTIQPQPVPGD